MIRLCRECKKEIKRFKFCSRQCSVKYHRRDYHRKMKNDPEYKRKRRAYFNKWLDNNRQKFNDYYRAYYKKRKKEPGYMKKRKEWAAKSRANLHAGWNVYRTKRKKNG